MVLRGWAKVSRHLLCSQKFLLLGSLHSPERGTEQSVLSLSPSHRKARQGSRGDAVLTLVGVRVGVCKLRPKGKEGQVCLAVAENLHQNLGMGTVNAKS